MKRAGLFVILLALRLFGVSAKSHVNPCHKNKKDEAEPGCLDVVMPKGMCEQCRLNAPLNNGYFKGCAKVYNINDSCLGKLKEYVKINTCDKRRKELVEAADKGGNPAAVESLDYFVYSMCEHCCDVVHKGSGFNDAIPDSEEYEERKAKKTLISNVRGNGPAHFHYDICKVLPKIQSLSLEGAVKNKNRKNICKKMAKWVKSKNGKGWLKNFNIKSPNVIKKMMDDSFEALQCTNKQTWMDCVNLEGLQGRLGYKPK